MLARWFQLAENGTTIRREVLAGVTTFLTMAYIIVVQPAVLTGLLGLPPSLTSTGLDFGAVTVATCLAAALATGLMGLMARYPIAQAPGMGENFFFVFSLLPAAKLYLDGQVAAGALQPGAVQPWQVGLGVIFISGVLFLGLSLVGVREALWDAISPSMRSGIGIGIGLFIALIGLQNASVVVMAPKLHLNPAVASPDMLLFFLGLIVTSCLYARKIPGSIILGILAAGGLAAGTRLAFDHHLLPDWIATAPVVAESMLVKQFALADHLVAPPPSLAPTAWKMDLAHAVAWPMVPFILIFLFMNLFDTLGTLIGVTEQAGLLRDGKLPRARRAFFSDAVGTTVGAALGTSTVVSYIESATGVEQGGRTGLTAVVAACGFLLALFFSPLIAMVGSYPPITAPALVIVGSLMIRSVVRVNWEDFTEAMPTFLIIIGIPLTYSIADGLALGFITYPVVKLFAGKGGQVKPLMYVLAAILVAYFVFVRMPMGG